MSRFCTTIHGKDFAGRTQVRVVEMKLLKVHENLDGERLANLRAEIEMEGILRTPIVVDATTKVVLDGHHRMGALKALGCSKIPVIFVDYQSPRIGVKTAENGEEYSKQKVVEAALKGELLPPKSTWHYIVFFKKKAHISKMQKPVNVPLRELREANSCSDISGVQVQNYARKS